MSVRDCNRIPCPAQWKPLGWSSCSKTCGKGGIEKREYICEPNLPQEKFYDCGLKPTSSRPCEQKVPACNLENNNNINPCTNQNSPECECKDASPICGDNVMMRYCAIPSYSALCCRSCKDHVGNK